MTMRIARTTVTIIGLGFAATGLALLLAPESYLARIDLRAGSRLAMSDVRALYGGLELTLGLLMTFWARRPESLGSAAMLAVTSFGGLVLGRIAAAILDGPPDSGLQVGVLVFEVAGLFVAGLALRAIRAKT